MRPLDEAQLHYMQNFKSGESTIKRGGLLIEQGQQGRHLYTLLDGVLIRYRSLDDGRRQIVNFLFPGDLVGLQAAFDDKSSHSVEALLDSRLCLFDRERFPNFIAEHPRLAYDLVWLCAKSETQLEEHIVALGQRTAKERVAYLAVWLVDRAIGSGIAIKGRTIKLPIKQAQIADMLGLSLVHTNRTIKALKKEGLVEWQPGELTVADMAAACDFAQYERDASKKLPYI